MNSTAIELATLIETIISKQGMHIALTGGTLYKTGTRKDIDYVLYVERNRSVPRNMADVLHQLEQQIPDLVIRTYYGFVIKATYKGNVIDFLYPEYSGGTYPGE